jgi:hypothetical protein
VTKVTLRRARPDEASMLSDLALAAKGFWGYDQAFIGSCRGELTFSPDDIARRHFVVADLGGLVAGRAGCNDVVPARSGSRLTCRVLAPVDDIPLQDKIDRITRRLASQTATGDNQGPRRCAAVEGVFARLATECRAFILACATRTSVAIIRENSDDAASAEIDSVILTRWRFRFS